MEFMGSKNIDRKTQLILTTAADHAIKDCEYIEFTDWMIWADSDTDGFARDNLAVMGVDGNAYYTQSKSFIAEFVKIAAIMGDDFTDCQVVSSLNKNGDTYFVCRAGTKTFNAC